MPSPAAEPTSGSAWASDPGTHHTCNSAEGFLARSVAGYAAVAFMMAVSHESFALPQWQTLPRLTQTLRVSPRSQRSVPPEVFEPVRRKLAISNRVLDVLMPEIMLQAAGIDALVGQLVAAAVPEHVRMDWERNLGGYTEAGNHTAEARRTHWRAPLGQEDVAAMVLLTLQTP